MNIFHLTMAQMHLTEIVILAIFVIAVVFDFFVYVIRGNASTESATTWRWSVHIPPIAFGAGILCGHLFFQMHDPTAFATDVNGTIVYQVGDTTLIPGEILTIDSNGNFIPKPQ
jgi:hypothetical protein